MGVGPGHKGRATPGARVAVGGSRSLSPQPTDLGSAPRGEGGFRAEAGTTQQHRQAGPVRRSLPAWFRLSSAKALFEPTGSPTPIETAGDGDKTQ